MERYEEASSNQYSEDVQVLLRVKEQGDGKSLAYNTHPASFKPPVEVHLFMQFVVKVTKQQLTTACKICCDHDMHAVRASY